MSGQRSPHDALWERNAAWWQRSFTSGADPEYEDLILPLVARHAAGARRILDIGCGEGQVSRRLADLGTQVVGLDPTPSQVGEAHARGGGPQYMRAGAEALPCRDGGFDTVVLCLALEHVDAFEVAFHEVARVLEPGGRLVLLLVHPFLQAPGSAWVEDGPDGAFYWRIGSYLPDNDEIAEVEPGVLLRLIHRPLSRYVHAMGQAGLLIEDMEEPPPPEALLDEAWPFPEARTIPRVLCLRARRLP